MLILWRKLSANFCGAFVFHEVMKLQSFELNVIDVIFQTCLGSLDFVFHLMEKKLAAKFYNVFDYVSKSSEITRFWMIRWSVDVITPSPRINIDDVLIVAYKQTLFYDKKIILSESYFFGRSSPLKD